MALIKESGGSVGEGALLNGRFELIKCVGAGGMSTVYKALDRRKLVFDNREPYVAVKILNPRFAPDSERLGALQLEVERCQRLVHPNIVRVYEFHREGPIAYMSMECLYGEPLTQRIRHDDFKGLPPGEALRIVDAMGQALGFAHSQGIVHCDFKPGNVFLTEAGEVKLIDFGIARTFRDPEEAASRECSFEAVSPAYASPDILEGWEPDPRDDVYALACTAYELLSGAHPFAYKSAIEAREAGLTVEQCAELTRGQWKALRGGLSFERDKRTPTIEQFLEEFIRGDRPRRRVSIAMGLVAFLMVFAVLIWRLNESVIKEWLSPTSSGSGVPTPGGRLSEAKDESTATRPSVQRSVAQRESQREPPPAQRLPPGEDDVGEALQALLVPEASSEGPLGEAEVVRPGGESAVAARRAETVADEAGSSAEKIVADAEDTAPLTSRVGPIVGEQASETGAVSSRDSEHAATALSEKERVSKLLALAKAQMATEHLTTPAGNAAYESYQAVLALVPRHQGAAEGIERIKGQYETWAQAARRRGDWERAQVNLEQALAIKPQDRQVIKALRELKKARTSKKEKARGKMETELGQALNEATHRFQELENRLAQARRSEH
ncbi:MAG: serine/threonine protein kinase [Pseudomonadota bacterium]|nr:serine/threonine protein kinase [Pseudomonadota bacterium]